MNRSTFFGTAGALGTIEAGASSVPAAAQASRVAMPRKAHQFFSDFDMNYVFLGVLGGAYYGLADVGTALAIWYAHGQKRRSPPATARPRARVFCSHPLTRSPPRIFATA